jgi:hypothetical protein
VKSGELRSSGRLASYAAELGDSITPLQGRAVRRSNKISNMLVDELLAQDEELDVLGRRCAGEQRTQFSSWLKIR